MADFEEKTQGQTAGSEEVSEKPRRRGRKPMTEEEKAEAAKKRAQKKRAAGEMKPEVYVQLGETQANVEELVEAAKADFRSVKKRTRVTDLKLYIKPEEQTAYYVINETASGKVTY